MKKLFSIFTVSAMLLSGTVFALPVRMYHVEDAAEIVQETIAEQNADLSSETAFDGGDGTQDSPYLISNAEQLLDIAGVVNSAAGADLYFSLTSDIDLEGAEWTPIGTSSAPFNGAFYGNGYSVKNLKITKNNIHNGFFGYVQQASVSKLSIENMNISFEYAGISAVNAGLLAGKAYKKQTNPKIENTFTEIAVSGTISIASAKSKVYAGGMVGEMESSSGNYLVSDCLSLADIDVSSGSNEVYAGGIAACFKDNISSYEMHMEKSFFSGSVKAAGTNTYCGGIAGAISSNGSGWSSGWYAEDSAELFADTDAEYVITNCAADGSLYAESSVSTYIGRIHGNQNSYAEIKDCAYLDTQTVSAKKNGADYTTLTGSPAKLDTSVTELSDYFVGTLGFDESVWSFINGTPGLGYLCIYTITYNANGGENAPAEQTKKRGITLTLSTDIPTREHYTFRGWSTTQDGAAEYAAGTEYTANADVTLYAVWEANTVIVANLIIMGQTPSEEQIELANLYKDDEAEDGIPKINIKDLIALAQNMAKQKS